MKTANNIHGLYAENVKPLQNHDMSINKYSHKSCIQLKHGETILYKPKVKRIADFFKHVVHNLPFQFPEFLMKILPNRNANVYPKKQCVLMPIPIGKTKNLLHIMGHQLNDKTSKHLIITSNPVPTALLSETISCPELCAVLRKLKQECQCASQQSHTSISEFASVHNNIRFGMNSKLQIYTLKNVKGGVKYVTTTNANVGFESFQLFSDQINQNSNNNDLQLFMTPHLNMIKPHSMKTTYPLGSMSSQYILANELKENTIITMKIIRKSMSFSYAQRIEMVAEPLMVHHDRMQQKLTQTCFIGYLPFNGGKHTLINSCSLELDKSFDYALKIKNIGAKMGNVLLSTNTKQEFAGTIFRDTNFVEIHENQINSVQSRVHDHHHHHHFLFIVAAFVVFLFGGACFLIFRMLKDMVRNGNNDGDNKYTRKQLKSDEFFTEETDESEMYHAPTLPESNRSNDIKYAGKELNSDDCFSAIEIKTTLPESNV